MEKEADVEEPQSYAATGLDNALDLLEVVTAKMDKASVGQRAAGLEQHPEVRAIQSPSVPNHNIIFHNVEEVQGRVRGVQGEGAAEREG